MLDVKLARSNCLEIRSRKILSRELSACLSALCAVPHMAVADSTILVLKIFKILSNLSWNENQKMTTARTRNALQHEKAFFGIATLSIKKENSTAIRIREQTFFYVQETLKQSTWWLIPSKAPRRTSLRHTHLRPRNPSRV